MDVCVSRPRGERLLGISLSSERTSANGLLLTFPDTDMGKKKRTSLQGTARVAQSLREAINNLGKNRCNNSLHRSTFTSSRCSRPV